MTISTWSHVNPLGSGNRVSSWWVLQREGDKRLWIPASTAKWAATKHNAELPVSTASRWAPPCPCPSQGVHTACSQEKCQLSVVPSNLTWVRPTLQAWNTFHQIITKAKKKKLDSSRQQIIYFQLSCSTCCTNSSTDGEVTCSKVAQNLDTFDTYCDDRTSEQVRFPNPDVFLMILQKK